MEKSEMVEILEEWRKAIREEMVQVLGVYTEYIDDRFKKIDERFDHLESRMDRMEARLDRHEEILKDLTVDMVAVKSELRVINAKLDRKADVKDQASRDHRLTALEARK